MNQQFQKKKAERASPLLMFATLFLLIAVLTLYFARDRPQPVQSPDLPIRAVVSVPASPTR